MLSVDIFKNFGAFHLQVQLEADHETLALLGASGSGKSVTLRAIAGLLTPDQGKILLDGKVLFDSAAKINLPPQERQVGYLFQQYALFPNLTVRQNIAAGTKDKSAVSTLLRQFYLEDVQDLKPYALSGGQQQRTALARILASRPKSILLDEPFSALDAHLRRELEQTLRNTLDAFDGTVLWVSHDRKEVWRNCSRICILEQGRSQPVVTKESLLCDPLTLTAARLSGCENDLKVIPQGDSVYIPQWNRSLFCGRPVPQTTTHIGIRGRHVHFGSGENEISCKVLDAFEDVFETTLLLLPVGATGSPLEMELPTEEWKRQAAEVLQISIAPKDILLLQE